MKKRAIALALLALLALTAQVMFAERIVAIGDIHGDLEAFVGILQTADLIDDDRHWSGGSTVLVQTGDYLDRGPQSMQVMDLLMALQQEAAAAGGRVEVMLGNHEGVNLLGELGDVSAESLTYFADETSEEAREAEYAAAVKTTKRRLAMADLPRPVFDRGAKEAWMASHPPGLIPYLESIGPNGKYGRWLRQRPIATKVGDTLFLHGGLNTEFGAWSLEDLNARVHRELQRADRCRQVLTRDGFLSATSSGADMIQAGLPYLEKLRKRDRNGGLKTAEERDALQALENCEDFREWFLLREDGPLWFRGYSPPRGDRGGWTEDNGGPDFIAQVLDAQGANHVVVGHTVQDRGEISERFDGRIFLMDTGMLSAVYNGQASALEIVDGVFTAIYEDRRVHLWGEPATEAAATSASKAAPDPKVAGFTWRGREGEVSFASEDELLDFLHQAQIVATKVLDTGTNETLRVDLERDGVRLRAAFRFVDLEWRNEMGPGGLYYRLFRDSYAYECAAYELSRMLGLDRVPPAVLRRYRGRTGSIQAWVENASTMADIEDRDQKPPDAVRWTLQAIDGRLFDVLVNNQDRNLGNALIDADWKVWLIDHTRTFLIDPDPERIASVSRASRAFWKNLRTADRNVVEKRITPFLSQEERRALFDRWDAIVAHLESEIEERGEATVLFP